MSISILCVTKLDPHAEPFLLHLSDIADLIGAQLVVGVDGPEARDQGIAFDCEHRIIPVQSAGYIESVLEDVLAYCTSDYVLRMDDDERCSPAMVQWLLEKKYEAQEHWKFPTANLWGDNQSIILNCPLWPDHHTRLSLKALSGGRNHPHCGSPYGGGELAPVIHEHHKFLVKSLDERRQIAARYDSIGMGYGTADNMRPFSLPETCYDELTLAPLGDGTVRDWDPSEFKTVKMERVAL